MYLMKYLVAKLWYEWKVKKFQVNTVFKSTRSWLNNLKALKYTTMHKTSNNHTKTLNYSLNRLLMRWHPPIITYLVHNTLCHKLRTLKLQKDHNLQCKGLKKLMAKTQSKKSHLINHRRKNLKRDFLHTISIKTD